MVKTLTIPNTGRGGLREPPGGRPKKPAKLEEKPVGQSPLEYMLSVMNDNNVDVTRRDRMAIAAAPYVHGRSPEAQPGKKEAAMIEAQTAHEDTGWSGLVN